VKQTISNPQRTGIVLALLLLSLPSEVFCLSVRPPGLWNNSLLWPAIILIVFTFIVSFLFHVDSVLSKQITAEQDQRKRDLLKLNSLELHEGKYLLLYLLIAMVFVFCGYHICLARGMEAHFLDWIHLAVRWAHVLFGIAWIGASFYFIFLENSLNRTDNLRDDLAGNLWAIHGGGFYYLEKFKIAPPVLPSKLHWFKYEAYFTWLSGFLLLILVYYLNAGSFMLNENGNRISASASVLLGLGSMAGGWILYDLLCRSPLAKNQTAFLLVGFTLTTIIAFILSFYLSGRAAFMHIGAMLGTIMAANVFFVIIPSQKALVRAALEGKPLNPQLGKNAGLRSLHNNYITLPVIFMMISNHFPSTFGNAYNWAILIGISIAGALIRHFINKHEQGKNLYWIIPAATVALLALMVVTAPDKSASAKYPHISFAKVEPVFKTRCAVCHSSHPTDSTQSVAPNGIMFDTPEQIQKMSQRILIRAVQTRTMPQGNKTQITDQEREMIGAWIQQGAEIQN